MGGAPPTPLPIIFPEGGDPLTRMREGRGYQVKEILTNSFSSLLFRNAEKQTPPARSVKNHGLLIFEES